VYDEEPRFYYFLCEIDRKRLAGATCKPSTSATTVPAKKPKLGATVLSRPESGLPASPQDTNKSWELAAVDIEAINLVPTIEAAKDKEEYDKIVSVVFRNRNRRVS